MSFSDELKNHWTNLFLMYHKKMAILVKTVAHFAITFFDWRSKNLVHGCEGCLPRGERRPDGTCSVEFARDELMHRLSAWSSTFRAVNAIMYSIGMARGINDSLSRSAIAPLASIICDFVWYSWLPHAHTKESEVDKARAVKNVWGCVRLYRIHYRIDKITPRVTRLYALFIFIVNRKTSIIIEMRW